MKKIALALLAPALALATISNVSKPYTIDTATTPRVRYIDANDSAIQRKLNEVVDTANLIWDGYLKSNLLKTTGSTKLIIDADSNETGKMFLFANHLNDTLFKLTDDSIARFYGNVTLNKKLIVTDSVRLTQLTASLPVFTTANKQLTTNAITGTGNVVMSASPTFTGTAALNNITVGGTAAFNGGTVTIGDNTTTRALNSNGPAGSNRDFAFHTAGVGRWSLRASSGAETGSDAGTNFQLVARDDAGNAIDNPITITRQSGGVMTLSRPISASSTLGVTGKATLSDSLVGVNERLTGNISAVQATFSGATTVGGTSGLLNIKGAAGSNRTLVFNTDNTNRWIWVVTNTSESGSDAGSNINLMAVTDDGFSSDTVISAVRATTGKIKLHRQVTLADSVFVTRSQSFSSSSTPPSPAAGAMRTYFKTPYIVYQYNDAGTVRYKYLDLSGTGVTWVHSTTAP